MKKIANSIDNFFKALMPTVDWKSVSASTYARYALMILSSLNSILTALGTNPLPYSEDDVYVVVSTIITVLLFIVNTYKDNPTSSESIFSNAVQKELKNMTPQQKEELKAAILVSIGTVKAEMSSNKNTQATTPVEPETPTTEEAVAKVTEEPTVSEEDTSTTDDSSL